MRLRIATFNLESLGEGPDLDDRIAMLRPQVERLDADVLMLQEVNGDAGKHRPRGLTALSRLLDGTRHAGWPLVSTSGRDPASALDVHNLVIVSRLPLAAHRQVAHELVPPPMWRLVTAEPPPDAPVALRWHRPLLLATATLPDGRPLHLVDLHLKAPLATSVTGGKTGPFAWNSTARWAEGFAMAALKRTGQALEARLLVDRLLDDDPAALVLVAGDFNAEAHEMPVRLLLAEEEDTGSGHLGPRALVALARSLPLDRRYTVRHHGRGQLLDHMLASRPLLAHYRGIEVHNETLGDEVVAYAAVDRSAASYHAPLVATFEFG